MLHDLIEVNVLLTLDDSDPIQCAVLWSKHRDGTQDIDTRHIKLTLRMGSWPSPSCFVPLSKSYLGAWPAASDYQEHVHYPLPIDFHPKPVPCPFERTHLHPVSHCRHNCMSLCQCMNNTRTYPPSRSKKSNAALRRSTRDSSILRCWDEGD